VLYVSHNMRTVSQLCTRGLFLHQGQLLYDGTTEKAIELYGGAGNRDVVRDLDSMTRPRNRGERMRLKKMVVLNSTNMEFQQDDVWEFNITGVSNVDEKSLRLRLILKNNLATPIAMTHTMPFEVKEDEKFTLNVRFPLDGIAPGEYMVKLSLISDRLGGGSNYYDTIEDIGQFIIIDDPQLNDGFTWVERLWGNMRLKKLEMARIENED